MINATAPAMRRYAQTRPIAAPHMPQARPGATPMNANAVLSGLGVVGLGLALYLVRRTNNMPAMLKQAMATNNTRLLKAAERPLIEKIAIWGGAGLSPIATAGMGYGIYAAKDASKVAADALAKAQSGGGSTFVLEKTNPVIKDLIDDIAKKADKGAAPAGSVLQSVFDKWKTDEFNPLQYAFETRTLENVINNTTKFETDDTVDDYIDKIAAKHKVTQHIPKT